MVYEQEFKEAAWPCALARLRQDGVRRPASDLAKLRPREGWIVGVRLANWQIQFFDRPELQTWVANLVEARLHKENDGIRLYQGMEWAGDHRIRQTWLAGPTVESVRAVLERMA